MNYWLYKSEPHTWSWDQQKAQAEKGMHWDGVRNHQAHNNMKRMKTGDLGFFYHSGAERSIVGIVKVVREVYPDHTDPTGRFGMVDLVAVSSMPQPVSLAQIKAHPELESMILVRNSRLSVQPVTASEWKIICSMGGYDV